MRLFSHLSSSFALIISYLPSIITFSFLPFLLALHSSSTSFLLILLSYSLLYCSHFLLHLIIFYLLFHLLQTGCHVCLYLLSPYFPLFLCRFSFFLRSFHIIFSCFQLFFFCRVLVMFVFNCSCPVLISYYAAFISSYMALTAIFSCSCPVFTSVSCFSILLECSPSSFPFINFNFFSHDCYIHPHFLVCFSLLLIVPLQFSLVTPYLLSCYWFQHLILSTRCDVLLL